MTLFYVQAVVKRGLMGEGAKTYYYRPQTKFAKVMFLHLSVSHSVQRGEYLGRYTPLGRYNPRQVHPLGRYTHPPGRYTPRAGTPPSSACWDTVNKRAVRIPLECILVWQDFCRKLHENERNWIGEARVPSAPWIRQ